MPDSTAPDHDITALLQSWKRGDQEALERLAPRVYAELRGIAARALAHERPGHTLQSTALVHEAFLRLVDQRRVDWQSRGHFFGLAAHLMRRILVDHARRVGRAKRGGAAPRVSLDQAGEIADATSANAVDVHLLDTALRKLETLDSTQGRIVELRFFGGLTIEETADFLGVSPMTVKRDWAVAKAFLYRELAGDAARDAAPPHTH
jgi:RNA polymerase sigma factor (TIGR02999 family)